ncbi:unnamed protein product [Gulo gulo]|uniref:Uncharacterized protein n=1 Tax=Gulo gulo TaxID=48420 RepID=A0A9X9LTW3_GULGU|nr:unnamed protein product [Gulo gulo]
MKKFFGFWTGKGRSSVTFCGEVTNSLRAPVVKNGEINESQRVYNIRVKDLKKIHRAAIVGNIGKMQRLLLLGKDVNKRDKKKR